VEAEEFKGEKEPAHYAATGIFQMEIVRPHPPASYTQFWRHLLSDDVRASL
jgi:hypothetical protein